MAKNNSNNQEVAQTEVQVEETTEETVVAEEVKPVAPAKKETKAKKQDTKKAKKQSKIGKKFKEMGSELKKVNWPTFGQVCKKTGVVLAVVLIFAVVLFGIDRLLSLLFGLLTGI